MGGMRSGRNLDYRTAGVMRPASTGGYSRSQICCRQKMLMQPDMASR